LLYLTSRGVEGENEKGERSHDIHHADHPDTRYKRHNAISIGFTSHYRVMRSMFGDHMQDGTAGENIIIDFEEEIWLDDLGLRIEFHNPGSGKIVMLDVVKTAAPRDEFCHFATNSQDKRLDKQALKETLQFLENGRRGFLLTLGAGQEQGLVQPGDQVYGIS
jgi:hypothetical protein